MPPHRDTAKTIINGLPVSMDSKSYLSIFGCLSAWLAHATQWKNCEIRNTRRPVGKKSGLPCSCRPPSLEKIYCHSGTRKHRNRKSNPGRSTNNLLGQAD